VALSSDVDGSAACGFAHELAVVLTPSTIAAANILSESFLYLL